MKFVNATQDEIMNAVIDALEELRQKNGIPESQFQRQKDNIVAIIVMDNIRKTINERISNTGESSDES